MAKTIEASNFFSNKSNLLGVIILVAALGYSTYSLTYQPYEAPLKLTLFANSLHPKSILAENEIIAAAKNFGDETSFRVYFLLDEANGRIESPGGEKDVAESMRQLCIQEHYPDDAYMDYLLCINEVLENASTAWQGCASDAGIDPASMSTCTSSGEAEALARKNIAFVKGKNVVGSPVLFMNNLVYKGPYFYESIIMNKVCDTVMPGLQGCSLRKTGKANIIIITDDGSTLLARAIDGITQSLEEQFSNYELRRINYQSEEARGLIGALNITSLPAVVYDSTFPTSDGYSELKYFVREEGDYYVQKNAPVRYINREEISESLIVFALAECRFSADFASKQVKSIVLTTPLRPEIHFIVRQDDEGGLESLHGQSEIDEEMRQVCMMKHYPEEYYRYLFCVSKNISMLGELRQGCAGDAGINMAVIEQCVAEEGKELLLENSKASEGLKIAGTPSGLINNQLIAEGSAASDADKFICDENPDIDCTKVMEIYEKRKYRVRANICYQIPEDEEMCGDFIRDHPEVLEQTGPILPVEYDELDGLWE
jgi:hypothetical protein